MGLELRTYSVLVVANIVAFDISYCARTGTTGCTTSDTDLVLRVLKMIGIHKDSYMVSVCTVYILCINVTHRGSVRLAATAAVELCLSVCALGGLALGYLAPATLVLRPAGTALE